MFSYKNIFILTAFILVSTFSHSSETDLNLYKILGVSSNASPEEIKEAYQQLRASKDHPDKKHGNTEAVEEMMKEVDKAYETLKDPQTRAASDAQPSHNLYKILGVSSNASPEEIKEAYRRRISKYHPDRHLENTKLTQLAIAMTTRTSSAYETLKDPQTRAAYDAQRTGRINVEDYVNLEEYKESIPLRNIRMTVDVGRDLYERLGLSPKEHITDKKIKKQFKKISSQINEKIIREVKQIPLGQRRGELDIRSQTKLMKQFHKLYEAYLLLSDPHVRNLYGEALRNTNLHSIRINLTGDVLVLKSKGSDKVFLHLNGKPYLLEALENDRYALKLSLNPPENRSFSDYIPSFRKIFGTNQIDLFTQVEYLEKTIFEIPVETDLKEARLIGDKPNPSQQSSNKTQMGSSTAQDKLNPFQKRSGDKSIASFSPKDLTHEQVKTIINTFSNSHPNSLHSFKTKEIIKGFPKSATIFYLTIGATMVAKDVFWDGIFNEDQSANPDFLPTFVDQFTSPSGILSFFLFVYTADKMNGLTARSLNKLLDLDNNYKKQMRESLTRGVPIDELNRGRRKAFNNVRHSLRIGLKGMRMPLALSAGMFVSSIVHEISADINLKQCFLGFWSQEKREDKNYLDYCQFAYSNWTNKGDEWIPSIFGGLIPSAISANLLTQSSSVMYNKGKNSVRNFMNKPTVREKIPSWKIGGLSKIGSVLGRLFGKLNGFTVAGASFFHMFVFFELNTYLFEPYVVRPLQIKNLAERVFGIRNEIDGLLSKNGEFENKSSENEECSAIDFSDQDWFESMSTIWNNVTPNEDCFASYLSSLIEKHDFEMNMWRMKQLHEFAYAHIEWEKSVSEVKMIHNEFESFLGEIKDLDTLDLDPASNPDLDPAYNNLKPYYYNSESDSPSLTLKLEKSIGLIDEYLNENKCDNDLSIDDILDTESKYSYFKKTSKTFFDPENDNKNLCRIKKLFSIKVTTEQDIRNTDFRNCMETKELEKCHSEYKEIKNQNLEKISAGIQMMNQWIDEKFSRAKNAARRLELFTSDPISPVVAGIELIVSSTPVSDVLLSVKETLKIEGEDPKVYSTPLFFVTRSDSLKQKMKLRTDQNTWSYNKFFTQYAGNYPLEEMVFQMVCEDSIPTIENIQDQCSSTTGVADLTEKLPSFDKIPAGPYQFKIPQLVSNIPKDVKEDICNQKQNPVQAFYSTYKIEKKSYNNLLELILDNTIDEEVKEKVNTQYNLIMDCFEIAYRNMYDTKLIPMISDESIHLVLSDTPGVRDYRSYNTTKIDELPKGTFQSIRTQTEYYFDLLKKIKDTDEVSKWKNWTLEKMDAFFTECIEQKCDEPNLYRQVFNWFFEENKRFPPGSEILNIYIFPPGPKTVNIDGKDVIWQNIIYQTTASLLSINIEDIDELTNKEKSNVIIIHGILRLQKQLEEIQQQKNMTDSVIHATGF